MAEGASVGMEGPGCGSSDSEVSMDKGQQHPLTPTKNLKINQHKRLYCTEHSSNNNKDEKRKKRKVNCYKNCIVLSTAATTTTTKKQPIVVLIHSTMQQWSATLWQWRDGKGGRGSASGETFSWLADCPRIGSAMAHLSSSWWFIYQPCLVLTPPTSLNKTKTSTNLNAGFF